MATVETTVPVGGASSVANKGPNMYVMIFYGVLVLGALALIAYFIYWAVKRQIDALTQKTPAQIAAENAAAAASAAAAKKCYCRHTVKLRRLHTNGKCMVRRYKKVCRTIH
jgi:hypothetical protein